MVVSIEMNSWRSGKAKGADWIVHKRAVFCWNE